MEIRLILGLMGIVCIIMAGLTLCQLEQDELGQRQKWLIHAMSIAGMILVVISVPPLVGYTIVVVVITSTIFAVRQYRRLPQV